MHISKYYDESQIPEFNKIYKGNALKKLSSKGKWQSRPFTLKSNTHKKLIWLMYKHYKHITAIDLNYVKDLLQREKYVD